MSHEPIIILSLVSFVVPKNTVTFLPVEKGGRSMDDKVVIGGGGGEDHISV